MSGVFKAYDIRGIYGKDLTDDVIYKVGLALGKYFENDEYIGIVRDIRLSSPRIRDILIKALLKTHNVIDFGIGSTPEAHYIAKTYTIPVLMITASHDPKEYNGIKPIKNDGYDLSKESEEMKVLETIYNNIDPNSYNINIGTLEYDYNAIEKYKEYLKFKFRIVQGYNIGYDPSNSVMALFKDVLIDLGNNVYSINENFDGNFPAHPPNPAVEGSMKQLQDLVKEKKLDFGFMFDGDGDRIGIIDNKGEIFYPYKYALAFIEHHRNKKFVIEVSLPIFLRRELGNNCIISRTGHTYVIEEAIKNKAFMGIEFSGHIFPEENSYIDDAFYGGLMLIKEFRKHDFWFDDIKNYDFQYKEYDIPRDRLNYDLVEKAKQFGKENGYLLSDLNGLLFDGIELLKENQRILVRKSQTENIYRVIIESYDKNIRVDELYNKIISS